MATSKRTKCPFREYWGCSGLGKQPICVFPKFCGLGCPIIDPRWGNDVNCDDLTKEQLDRIRKEGRLWL